MVNRRILLVCVVALIAYAAQPAGAAPAERFETTVTLKLDTTPRSVAARGTFAWYGRVKSSKDECKNKRVVTLWTIPEGGGPPANRGEVLTEADGKWYMTLDVNYEGEYYAEASKRTLGSGNICKFARSESIIRDLG